ncbi:hypothetical protein KIW84_023962 [Lathyrus oleraceus]|uniref:RNase H type-1 domain-containing protein n=1 Tax=Pisum sativum TaxID=3888 RepID=A0A9D4YIW3_PEA|nr:hypothetical protein KIW84_023962 [Pisum sativum]
MGKYMPHADTGHVIAEPNDSHLWKNIVKLWPQLDKYSRWIIGDGETIDFLNDAWIENGLQLRDYNMQIPDHMQGNKLVDIVKNVEWHWRLIHAWLLDIILNKIAAIFLSNESNGYDIHVYKDDIDGRFSISGMYHLLCDFSSEGEDRIWKSIRKLKLVTWLGAGGIRRSLRRISRDNLVDRVKEILVSYSLTDKLMNIGGLIQEHRVNVGWKPPKEGWVCLNVDGACQNGVIGCGGVIRGSDEEWLGDFSNFIRRGEVYVT